MDRRRRASETNQPGVEPEIIPPDDVRWRRADSRMHSAQRVYVARIGPVGFAIMAVAIACGASACGGPARRRVNGGAVHGLPA